MCVVMGLTNESYVGHWTIWGNKWTNKATKGFGQREYLRGTRENKSTEKYVQVWQRYRYGSSVCSKM